MSADSEQALKSHGSLAARLALIHTGYRYFYMDYVKNGLTYDAAQSGLFMGVGVKF